MSTLPRVGDRALWRNPNDLTDTRICSIKSFNCAGAVPFGIEFTNKPFKGKTERVNTLSLEQTTHIFAKTVILGKYTEEYFRLCADFSSARIQNVAEVLYRSADLIMFTGGSDVSPWMYKEPRHEKTRYIDPQRDSIEARIYSEAKRLGIPCVGICRGAQFLNVMNGGKLIQHVNNHTKAHSVKTSCGHEFDVSSTHHQMMSPTDKAEILAWAEGLSDEYLGLEEGYRPCQIDNKIAEPEVVIYRDTGDLCVQFHPEIMGNESPARLYFKEILKELNK